MMKFIGLALVVVALAGCETSGEAGKKKDIHSMPEYAAHETCLGKQAFIFKDAEGTPLEAGTIASAACNSTRVALYQAIRKVESPSFAKGYLEASEENDPKMIAGVIAKARMGKDPFS
ncbi:hypothetical protein HFN68_24245 [Rhizobium laguerreae]|uniref:hypothetical protein n=1 Tax=Rhizobium laguerreae TaxID=1076926 RepID=UPI001C911B8D|nr:hypothetical protein [Rhizobium laguerreae]MBY3536000.1 hypothetical protein [Rhizobium laguerreae]